MKKKLKKILIALLVIFIIVIAGFFIIKNSLKPVVNDYTLEGNSETVDDSNDETTVSEEENIAKLSSLVKVIGEESANNVNAGITSLKTNSDSTITMTINSVGMSEFDDYGKGDIFILDGNSETPFGEVYIGKIVSKNTDSDGNLVVVLENPSLDEVFDEVHINQTTLLTEENVNNIATIDGVTIKFVDNLDAEMENVSNNGENNYTVTYLDGISEDDVELVRQADIATANASFLIELDTGLEYDFTTKKLTTKAKADITNEVNAELLEGFKSYSEDNNESYSYEETTGGQEASDTGSADITSKLELGLSGKIGIESLTSTLDFDFDIFKGGVQDLSWEFGGKAVASVETTGKYTGSIGGEGTSNTFGSEQIYAIKCEGLSKKTFPIAYIDFTGTQLYFDEVYQGITFIPVACGVMIYSDIEGNVTVSFSTSLEYSNEFNYKLTIFEDGKLCSDMISFTSEETGKAEFKFSAELYTDFTLLGFSGLITVSNINLLEVGLVDLGIEAEAEFSVDLVANLEKGDDGSYNWVKDEENCSIDASGYLRGYFKAVELKLRLKLNSIGVDKSSLFYLDKEYSYDFTLIDLTIWETGDKSSTAYDSGRMSYNLATASDENLDYYKEYSEKTSSSKLIERNSALVTQELETDGDFIGICGIDESFVYIFKDGSNGYDIYRVSKDTSKNGLNKIILKDIKTLLYEDETYFYYVETDSDNTIKMVDRSTLKTSTFQKFDTEIEPFYMEKSGIKGTFYVACDNTGDFWATLFGGCSIEYYYVNSSSSDPLEAEELFTAPSSYSYSTSAIMVGGSLLRGTVSAYYMNTATGTTIELTTSIGYVSSEIGIFTVDEINGVYTLCLYSGSDGTKREIIEFNNGNALWTITKGSDGYYYYLDQDDNKVSLYKFDINTSEKTLVKQYNDFNIDLNLCGVSQLGSTLFFYEMPDDNTLNVIYRYTIY